MLAAVYSFFPPAHILFAVCNFRFTLNQFLHTSRELISARRSECVLLDNLLVDSMNRWVSSDGLDNLGHGSVRCARDERVVKNVCFPLRDLGLTFGYRAFTRNKDLRAAGGEDAAEETSSGLRLTADGLKR